MAVLENNPAIAALSMLSSFDVASAPPDVAMASSADARDDAELVVFDEAMMRSSCDDAWPAVNRRMAMDTSPNDYG